MRPILHAFAMATLLVGCEGDSSSSLPPPDAGWDPDGGVDCENGPNYTNCPCEMGDTRVCYTGPLDTRNVGACHDGQQSCTLLNEFTTLFGPCEGEVLPAGCAGPEPECCTGSSSELRLIAPLSTSRATTNLPTLRWRGGGEVTVTLCRDRACSDVIESFAASNGSATPSEPLPAGVVFWRVESGGSTTPTWEVKVPPRAAAVDTSWGSFADVNGDGSSDLVLIDLGLEAEGVTQGPPQLYVYFGGSEGLPAAPSQTLAIAPDLLFFGPERPSGRRVRSGDVNGDGFADVAALGQLFLGSATGLASAPAWSFADPALQLRLPEPHQNYEVSVGITGQDLGDVNGDGYADLALAVGAIPQCIDAGATTVVEPPLHMGGSIYLFHGGPAGLGSAATVVLDSFAAMTDGCHESLDHRCTASVINPRNGSTVVADMNGDGYADLLTTNLLHDRAQLYLGSAAGLTNSVAQTLLSQAGDTCVESMVAWGMWASGSDFDGDGHFDVVVGQAGDLVQDAKGHLFQGGPSGFDTNATEYTAPNAGTATGLSFSFGWNDGVRNGDVDGDGFGDLFVGVMATSADTTLARLFRGASTGVGHAVAASLALGPEVEHVTGYTSANDDFNGDGLDDAVLYYRQMNATNSECLVYYATGDDALVGSGPSWELEAPAEASDSCCLH